MYRHLEIKFFFFHLHNSSKFIEFSILAFFQYSECMEILPCCLTNQLGTMKKFICLFLESSLLKLYKKALFSFCLIL